jgi:U3 small nucleolar ribonucleoprotein protein IMP4
MLRRDVRLRKDFLYKKAHEQQERTTFEKKKRLREALEGRKS